jgi:hypothetical protein
MCLFLKGDFRIEKLNLGIENWGSKKGYENWS